MRPNIGITTSLETVAYDGWVEPVAMNPIAYSEMVVQAGGRPVMLVATEEDAADPSGVLELLDGLIISGGAGDINPSHYGQAIEPTTKPVAAIRDEFELALVSAASKTELPLLGICRGMQVINVAYGGTLVQNLPDRLGHSDHTGETGSYTEHGVQLEPNSLAERSVGSEQTVVKSYHHQGPDQIGEGLVATGWAAIDDTVEAVEDPALPFMLGVLWHPEEDPRSRVIEALVKQCSCS